VKLETDGVASRHSSAQVSAVMISQAHRKHSLYFSN